MASVTFPAALGGDGKTYSDDADPNTGLDGLGYVERFVPCLQNAVAMAGYTAQYAAKIDAAAANADRAEDAKQYVEAVADAYAVNLLDAYRDKITLGADFKAGRYTRDDGVRLDTNDPGEIYSIVRATPKFLEGSNQYLREYAPDVVAREWTEGDPLGVVLEPNSQNLMLFSEDLTNPIWQIFSPVGAAKNGNICALNKPFFRYDDFEFSGSLSFLQGANAAAGQTLTLSVYISKETTPRYLVFNMGNDYRISIDMQLNEIAVAPDGVNPRLNVRPALNGTRIELTATVPTAQSRFGIFFRKSSSVSYNDSWFSGDVVALNGFQLELGDRATSYIPTLDSSVTRQSDQLFRISEGQFSRQQGTFYAQYLKPPGGFDYILGLGTANDEEINLGNSSVRSTFINLRSGGEFSSINAASLQSQIGELEKALFTYVFNGTSYVFELFVNGGFAGTGELTRLPAGFENNIAIGRRRANFNDLHANTNIFGFFYIPFQLSRAEAQELTAL